MVNYKHNKATQSYIEHVKKYYSDHSSVYHSCYDGEGDYPANAYRLEIARKICREMNPRPKSILDAGCGDARVLAELATEGFDCQGFDNNELMLELGSKILDKYSLSKDLIYKGDIYNIDSKDKHFDAIICLGVLSNLPYHKKIFDEFKRVLKPEGSIIVSFTNHLFDLFTLNQYTVDFYENLMKSADVPPAFIKEKLAKLDSMYDIENTPTPFKAMFDSDIDKKSIEIETYHQLNIDGKMREMGLSVQKIRHYHYHPFPPRFEHEDPELFVSLAQKLETTEYDWKGAILCSAMVVELKLDSSL